MFDPGILPILEIAGTGPITMTCGVRLWKWMPRSFQSLATTSGTKEVKLRRVCLIAVLTARGSIWTLALESRHSTSKGLCIGCKSSLLETRRGKCRLADRAISLYTWRLTINLALVGFWGALLDSRPPFSVQVLVFARLQSSDECHKNEKCCAKDQNEQAGMESQDCASL